MARTSEYSKPQAAAAPSGRVWQAALYVRLSREDGDKVESESILSQKAYLQDFLKGRSDLRLYQIYVDDGWSGTNFDRPQFLSMIEDIRARRVNCVIVKDLSRFGRNYIESGRYLETFFPMMRVRFISVNDHIDSYADPGSLGNMIVPMKNVMNDEYCRDISTKVRSSLNIRRSQGKFIGSFAAYGYRKDPADHNRLLIDEEAAQVVRSIYAWFLGGQSVLGIAQRLNAQGIPNPSEYKRRQGLKYRHPAGKKLDGLWPDSSVRRILRNELYTGVMVQHRNEVISYKVQISRPVAEREWIRVDGTHEAIISRETFDLAQALFARDTRTAPGKVQVGVLSGFVKCADCGRAMNRKRISQPYRDYDYYICSTFKKMKKGACTKHTIRSDRLEHVVLVTLQKQIALAVEMEELMTAIRSCEAASRSSQLLTAQLSGAEREQARIQQILLELYPDLKNGLLSQPQYLALKKQYEAQLEGLEQTIARLREQAASLAEGRPEENDFISSFTQFRNITALTREVVVALVENIYVHEDGSIDIQFHFSDSYELAAEFIENNRHLVPA